MVAMTAPIATTARLTKSSVLHTLVGCGSAEYRCGLHSTRVGSLLIGGRFVGRIVAITGGFGAGLALFGAVVSLFFGGMGATVGVGEGGAQALRSFGAIGMAILAVVGAITARSRLRTGAAMMVASAVAGLWLTPWAYLPGAVLLGAAAVMAVRGEAGEA